MHQTNLRKVGGSTMLAVPPVLLELLNLKAGETVGISVDKGRLIIEPNARPQYSLDELLAQCDVSLERQEDEEEWLESRAVGNELI